GHSPLRLRPAFLSWTRRPTTCATSTRSLSSCSLSSLIAASSCSRCSDALLTLGSERRLHRVAHPLSFGPACDLRHERLHHCSHPLRVGGARLGDGLAGKLGELVVAELPGQEGLEDHDLRFLVLRQFRSPAAAELSGGVPALLDERLRDLDYLGVRQLLAGLDLAVLEGALQHAQGAEPVLVARPRGVLQFAFDALDQHPGSRCSFPTNDPASGRGRAGACPRALRRYIMPLRAFLRARFFAASAFFLRFTDGFS